MEQKLSNPQVTIETIQKYDFDFRKKYGQNFLIDGHVLDKIIRAAEIEEEDCVLEIGPGFGTMTQELAAHAGKVLAIEIDEKLIPILKDTLGDYPNVKVIHGDVMKTDILALLKEEQVTRPIKVVANLPYYITTPIIMNLLEREIPVASITVMVQKEVADRMRVGPGTKDYGALSLAVKYYATCELIANVPPNCFIPRPNVSSAVICLKKHAKPPVAVQDVDLLFRLIRASFNQRRKTLVNGIKNAENLPYTKEQVEMVLESQGLPPTVRGEALTLEQFAALSDGFTALSAR